MIDEPSSRSVAKTRWRSAPSAVDAASGLVSGSGVFVGLGAIASTSCCALPIALSMAGVGGAWAKNLPQLAFYRDGFVAVALALVALGWMLALWKRRRGACACPGSGLRAITMGLLLVATGFLILSLSASWWEPEVLRLLALIRSSG